MKVTQIGAKKIIEYTPIKNGIYKTKDSVYEFVGKRLEINTILENEKKLVQCKTLTQNGQILKEIVIRYVDGIRKNILRLRWDIYGELK